MLVQLPGEEQPKEGAGIVPWMPLELQSCSACSASPWPHRDLEGTKLHQALIVPPQQELFTSSPCARQSSARAGWENTPRELCLVEMSFTAPFLWIKELLWVCLQLLSPCDPPARAAGQGEISQLLFVGCSLCWMTLHAQLSWNNINSLYPLLTASCSSSTQPSSGLVPPRAFGEFILFSSAGSKCTPKNPKDDAVSVIKLCRFSSLNANSELSLNRV